MEKKNVVIFVAGQRFSITTTDTPEYVIGIGEKIDVMIKGIQKDNPKLNRDACAILTALNICDDETKLRQMMEVLREQVKDYLNANESLRAENAALKKELEALKSASKASAPDKSDSTEEDTVTEEKESNDAISTVAVAQKAQSAVAAALQRQTAFVGKDFRSDKNKKNKHKHSKHQNNFPAPVAPAAHNAAPIEAQEAQAEEASPYHQFSIFDDLM